MIWKCGNFSIDLTRPKTMAIVNVTPDSFSDGGKYYKPEEAVKRALNAVDEGADIIDFGAESTRPDATPITWQEEWERLEKVLTAFDCSQMPVSVDTYHPETARRALTIGASIINCVKPESAAAMKEISERFGCGLVLPAKSFGSLPAGANETSVVIDPMIGFETSRAEDIALMRSIGELAKRAPVLVGVSRKRLVKKLSGEKCRGRNLGGSLGLAVWSVMNGASVVRVHDVLESVQAIAVISAIENK